jgi:hypothetical protein
MVNPASYSLRIFDSDDATPEQRRLAEARFRRALEQSLGDESLVLPVYTAFRRITAAYGESPDLEVLTDAERVVLEQWQAAEAAALAAAFGTHRYMGDAMYEIGD